MTLIKVRFSIKIPFEDVILQASPYGQMCGDLAVWCHKSPPWYCWYLEKALRETVGHSLGCWSRGHYWYLCPVDLSKTSVTCFLTLWIFMISLPSSSIIWASGLSPGICFVGNYRCRWQRATWGVVISDWSKLAGECWPIHPWIRLESCVLSSLVFWKKNSSAQKLENLQNQNIMRHTGLLWLVGDILQVGRHFVLLLHFTD